MLAWELNLGFAASPGAPPPVTAFQHSRRIGHVHDTVLRVLALLLISTLMH